MGVFIQTLSTTGYFHYKLLCCIALIQLCFVTPLFAIDPPSGVVDLYMQIKQIQAGFILPQTITSMPSTSTVKRHQFYKGNQNSAVIQKLADDYLNKHFKDVQWWWDCLEWAFEGVCYKCSNYDCEFDMYKSYYYPVQMYELSSKVFVSEYLYDTVFQTIGQQELEDYWYDTAKQETPNEMMRVEKELGASSSSAYSNYNFQLPNQFKSNDIRSANTAEQIEWRTFSPLAQSSYGTYPVPGDACHARVNAPVPYFSESPILIDFTRLGENLDLLFFPQMWIYKQKWGAELPNWGRSINLTLGLSPISWLSINNSMLSIIPDPMSSTAHLGADYGGTHMSGNEYSKKWLSAMLRASQYRSILPGIFPIQKYDRGRKKSRFQWLLPDHMPDSCKEHFPQHPFDSYGSFLNFGYHPEVDRDEEGRAVITQWQFFRCCPSGFDVLIGDTPQYKL